MNKADATERWIERLRELDAESPEALKTVREALSKGNARVAAAAARWVGAAKAAALCPELVRAFDRFLKNPVKTDPGCLAKMAAVQALDAVDHLDEEVFLRGLHYVQKEPAWGPPVDTAAALRGECALALAKRAYPHIRNELAALLADPEVTTRRYAVQAFANLGGEADEVALRLKALLGDAAPEIVEACLSGLLEIAPDRSLPFVESYLDADDEAVAEGAALALAQTHRPEVFETLRGRWDAWVGERRHILVLPLSLVRVEPAFEFLLEVIQTGHAETAAAAVEALAVYRDDSKRRDRIEAAVERRHDRAVAASFQRAFKGDA